MTEIEYKFAKRVPTAIDLFSGAGGMSLGFLMAGGTPIGAVDNDRDSILTYQKMFPYVKEVHYGDIEGWKPKSKLSKVNVIIGGPPCQGFSLARGLRFVDDPRNHLYKYFVQAVERFKPEWFVMENVQGITNIGGGVILNQILSDFTSLDYVVDYRVINMAEYGVPQLRKRAIFVGTRVKKKFTWPDITHVKKNHRMDLFKSILPKYVSVNDALGDLALPFGNYFAHRANSQMRGPRNRNAHDEPAFTLRVRGDEFALCQEPAISAFIPGPAPLENIEYLRPQNAMQEYFRQTPPAYHKKRKEKIKNRKQKRELIGTRKLTIKEQARLQSFPDWFEFEGTKYSKARQIGNAVPPLFAYHLFKQIFTYL